MYTVDYFIKKFEAIPEEKWFVGDYHSADKSRSCALGHCLFTEHGYDLMSPERRALECLFMTIIKNICVGDINDDTALNNTIYKQSTPKQRILAALYDIKKMQSEPEVQECDATKVESSTEAGNIKNTFKEVTFSKIKENIPAQSSN